MQKDTWSRKFDWVKKNTDSGITYIQENRIETYNEDRFIAVSDIYFKLNKYLTGITFTYINNLDDIYKRDLLTGDGYSIVNMYNEYDVIDRTMKNIVSVDVAADTNIDLNYQWFEINEVKLKPGHLVLLKSQNSEFENDIYIVNNEYFLDNSGILSTRDKSNKFSCSIKLGKNKDKQFFLVNNGTVFPIYYEAKYFIEGKSYLLKNLIKYDLYNTRTGTTTTSKIIFTDYRLAKTQLSENADRYDNAEVLDVIITSSPFLPDNLVTINYHFDSFQIRSGTTTNNSYTGSTNNIFNLSVGSTALTKPNIFNCKKGDYISLEVYSGYTYYFDDSTGSTSGETCYNLDLSLYSTGYTTTVRSVLKLNTFIKDIFGDLIILEDTIPNDIITDLKNCFFSVINYNVAYNWDNMVDILKNNTPYSDFYRISAYTYSEGFIDGIDIIITPIENVYDKYFDYNDITFKFTDAYYLFKFNTLNQYLKYNLYDRLNEINPIVFTTGFTFHNEYLLTGFTYRYTDYNNIKIITPSNDIIFTDIFKPYTYIDITADGTDSGTTLIYSVSETEMIIERPINWDQYIVLQQYPDIKTIKNKDGLKNISDILFLNYVNKSYDWYIRKSENERKYVCKSYAELLIESENFRNNITGILYENENNEFILKIYDIENDNNLTTFESIELIFVGSDRKTRLPVPLKMKNKLRTFTTNGSSQEIYWDILDGGLNDVLSGLNSSVIIGEVFDAGINVVSPGPSNLLFNVIDGNL